jgi:hypothetical protein
LVSAAESYADDRATHVSLLSAYYEVLDGGEQQFLPVGEADAYRVATQSPAAAWSLAERELRRACEVAVGEAREACRRAKEAERARKWFRRFDPGALDTQGETLEAARAATAVAEEARAKVSAEGLRDGAVRMRSLQAALLRDLFGGLFQSFILDPHWTGWNNGAALILARLCYENRAFDRLPILADALEDAGCTDQAILDHCRGPGPHVRGCWVVDLMLGKS